MTRLLLVLMCLVVLTVLVTAATPPSRIYIPVFEQPPWIDAPGKGVAGYLPWGESAIQHSHWQHQWNLTCQADAGINCINHLKDRGTMADLYPDQPGLLTETLQACSGGEWWYGDEFNIFDETRWPMSQWVEEAHWIRELFDQYAPDGCKFGFGVPLIGSIWWGRDGDEWIAAFADLYRQTYGEPLAVDVYLVDDYYRGPNTYAETVATHALIRSLYGQDVEIVAREWGALGVDRQKVALNYACQTGWHELYDRYYWFIGMVGMGTVWQYTALYADGMTEVGRMYAAFPGWYCGSLWR